MVYGLMCAYDVCVRLIQWAFRQYVRGLYHTEQRMYDDYSLKVREVYSWAVVTGGSDGLGLSMCENLAEEGWNICIISRDEGKMKDRLAKLKKDHPYIETRHIVADLSKMKTIKDYKDIIVSKISDIDVGILCVNAGVCHLGLFE